MKFGRVLAVALAGLALLATGAASAADYHREVWSPLHLAPNMAEATDAQCLGCHREILSDKPLAKSQSGIRADQVTAWYQTLDTYQGSQDTIHRRHLVTTYAKQVMNMKCSTCHIGHDPREEAMPQHVADGSPTATLRKQVNPEKTCLMCHGKFPAPNMGLEGDWSELRAGLESEDVKNGCLTCHAEQFRTNRHRVNFLNADNIEKLAQNSSDVCYGCHGGRSWYRLSFPYPRHPWPGMPDETPDWAQGRPTDSDPRFLIGVKPTKASKN